MVSDILILFYLSDMFRGYLFHHPNDGISGGTILRSTDRTDFDGLPPLAHCAA